MLCLAKKRLEEQTPAEEEEEDRLLQAEPDRNQKEIKVLKILGPSFQEKQKGLDTLIPPTDRFVKGVALVLGAAENNCDLADGLNEVVAPSVEFAKTSGFMKGVAPADRLIKQKVVKGTAAVRCCDAVVTGGGEAEPACCCGRGGIDGKPKFQAEKASLPRGSARRDAAVSASEMRRAERLCPAAERAWQEVAKRTWRTVTAAAASKRSPSSS